MSDMAEGYGARYRSSCRSPDEVLIKIRRGSEAFLVGVGAKAGPEMADESVRVSISSLFAWT